MHWWLGWLLACSTPSPEPAPEPQPVVEAPEPRAPSVPDPMAWPRPTETKLAATHVLVAWKGAKAAPASVRRSEDEALARARALHARVASGADIQELARSDSDDPTGRRGGRLGAWRTGVMDDAFERCVVQAEAGELTPLCRTDFGFHVVRRDPVVEAGGRALVVELAADADDEVQARAHQRAEGLRQALAGGEAFDAVAARADRALPLGTTGGGQLFPALESALFAMDQPGVSDVIPAPGGLYVVVREGP